MATKQKAKEKKWKPKYGSKYYYINMHYLRSSAIEWDLWENTLQDKSKFRSGNCFRTKTEAKKKCTELNRAIKQILTK